jgi:Cell division protein
MSVFDQRGQKVVYQYNAAGNVNFGNIENRADLIGELEKLKTEISKARDAEIIDTETLTDIQYQIQKAVDQAQKTEPNKNAILEHLSKAREFIKDVVDVAGLVAGITKAIELTQHLF